LNVPKKHILEFQTANARVRSFRCMRGMTTRASNTGSSFLKSPLLLQSQSQRSPSIKISTKTREAARRRRAARNLPHLLKVCHQLPPSYAIATSTSLLEAAAANSALSVRLRNTR
jgi:hypothetical protein